MTVAQRVFEKSIIFTHYTLSGSTTLFPEAGILKFSAEHGFIKKGLGKSCRAKNLLCVGTLSSFLNKMEICHATNVK